jgi:hypothetical protein
MEGALRRDWHGTSAVALSAVAMAVAVALGIVAAPGCKKSRTETGETAAEEIPPAEEAPSAEETGARQPGAPGAPGPNDETGGESRPPAGPTGTITGTVKLTGAPPEMPLLQRGSDGFCARKEMHAETVLTGTGGALVNALVRIEPGAVPAWVPSEPVVVDQVDCMYRPRVQGGVRGQTLEVRNSDGTAHNVNARRLPWGERRDVDTIFNRGQPAGSPPLTGPIRDGDILKLKCDSHGWMQGYVVVGDNPYFAATGEDGRFAIENAPVGTYTLQSWHEYYGVKTQTVTVNEDGATASVDFTYDAEKDRPAQAGAR